MTDKVREALDRVDKLIPKDNFPGSMDGFDAQAWATLRAYIEGLESRLADGDLMVAYMAGVEKGREAAEARVRELEGTLGAIKHRTDCTVYGMGAEIAAMITAAMQENRDG